MPDTHTTSFYNASTEISPRPPPQPEHSHQHSQPLASRLQVFQHAPLKKLAERVQYTWAGCRTVFIELVDVSQHLTRVYRA